MSFQNGGPLRTLDLEQASASQKTPALQASNENLISPFRMILGELSENLSYHSILHQDQYRMSRTFEVSIDVGANRDQLHLRRVQDLITRFST